MSGSQEWLDRDEHPYLDDQQWSSLLKLEATIGRSGVYAILSRGQEETTARVTRFQEYESALERHIIDRVTASIPSPVIQSPPPTVIVQQQPSSASTGPKPVRVKVSPYTGSESENLIFWQREVELALIAGCVRDARQQVTFAISHMTGRAKEWALTCETTQPECFQDWRALTDAMKAMFLPPNVAYRQRVAFLACKQGERDLYAFVQELRQLRASMVANSIPEDVMLAVFMEGMKFGPAKTALFREAPSTLEAAITIALREDHCERQARGLPTNPSAPSTPGGSAPEPMDLSSFDIHHVDLSIYDLSAIDARALHVKCYTCDKMGHFQRDCPRNRGQRGDRFRRFRGRGPRSGGSAPTASQGNGSSQ